MEPGMSPQGTYAPHYRLIFPASWHRTGNSVDRSRANINHSARLRPGILHEFTTRALDRFLVVIQKKFFQPSTGRLHAPVALTKSREVMPSGPVSKPFTLPANLMSASAAKSGKMNSPHNPSFASFSSVRSFVRPGQDHARKTVDELHLVKVDK